jgi:hypothetical protein
MSDQIALLTIGSSLSLFLWHFIKAKGWKESAASALLPALKFGALLLAPYLALFALSKLGESSVADSAGYFAIGLLTPCLLSPLVKSPQQRSLFLLAAVAGCYYAISEQSATDMVALICGMLLWKVGANVLSNEEPQTDDVLPPLVCLSIFFWLMAGEVKDKAAEQQIGLVLGTLSTSLVLRSLQQLFLQTDKFFLKRIALATAGGLSVLLIASKIILVGHWSKLCILAGVAFLGAYIFAALDKAKTEAVDRVGYVPLSLPLMQLLLIGIFTLASNRLFGTLGTLVVAAAMPSALKSRTAQLAGIFWCGRALVESYVLQNNPNVTGINLNHAYTSAALFAGFLLMVVLPVWIRESRSKKGLVAMLAAVATLSPIAAAYLLHAEPTSSLLIASITAGIVVVLFIPSLMKMDPPLGDTAMLLPVLMCGFAHLASSALLEGEDSTTEQKLTAIAALVVAVVCVSLVQRIFNTKAVQKQPAQ